MINANKKMLKTMIEEQLLKVDKIVGLKQSIKKLAEDRIKKVYIAKDADKRVIGDFEKLCSEKEVPIEYVVNMELLGKAAGIRVGAAIVSVLK